MGRLVRQVLCLLWLTLRLLIVVVAVTTVVVVVVVVVVVDVVIDRGLSAVS